jgi:uncharacterized protein YgiM (DUF1202 family)
MEATMKETRMKKIFIALFTLLFLVVSTGPAFAGYYRHPYARSYHHGGHSYHHGHSGGDLWVALGFGLLTGGLISYMVNTPPSQTVVYASPEPVVVAPSSRVVVKEYAYVPPQPLPAVEKVVVTAQELNVRRGPGYNHAIAGYVVMGEALEVLGSAPGWYHVRTASGLYGWVMVNFTAPQVVPVG